MLKVIKIFVKMTILISLVASIIAFFVDWKKRVEIQKIHKFNGIYEKYFKRALDVFVSVGAFVVFGPLILLLAIAVKIKHGSPVIFKQRRPGMIDPKTGKERVFSLYKFRTMTNECDDLGELLPDEQRLTEFGKWLRSTSLDELPELINIIKGDMSIVGPRPLLEQYIPYYTEKERHRHDVRPGLTGLAQINGRNFVKWDQRLAYDVEYSNNISLFNDIRIVISTVGKVILGKNIAVNTDSVEEYLDIERGAKRC